MKQIIKSVPPQFADNYRRGWAGFTFHDDSFVSNGIAWFSRPDLLDLGDRKASHTLIVSGFDSCIEAQPKGVVESDLAKYFNDPHCHVFFRCPVGYTEEMGDIIVDAAAAHIGDGYGYGLIVADALAGSIAGRILNKLLFNLPHRLVSGWLDGRKQEICSELVALALQSVPALARLGCLTQPARMITPVMLAFDDQVFLPLRKL